MEGQGAKEIVCSTNKIFVFHIFHFVVEVMVWHDLTCLQCNQYDLNVQFLNSAKKFDKDHKEVLTNKHPKNKEMLGV
jgi:hypothetical protein